jgi:hypothetical protein
MELPCLHWETAPFVIGTGKSLAVFRIDELEHGIVSLHPPTSVRAPNTVKAIGNNSGIFIGSKMEICCWWMTVGLRA